MSGVDDVTIRLATEDDLEALVHLLHDDVLGHQRENASEHDLAPYRRAFRALDDSADYAVWLMEAGGEVIGCYQLMHLPHLSFQGGLRTQIESVRIATGRRGQGLGKRLIAHAVQEAKARGAKIVQLTSNKERTEAARFYRAFGFEPTHDGYKLYLSGAA